MSRDTTGNAALIVHNGEELEPDVRFALVALLATQPTPAEVACAMNQLRLARYPTSLAIATSTESTRNRRRTSPWLLVAAGVFVFCMCGIASTESWAQVAKDFSDPLNEPQPLSTLAEKMANASHQAGSTGFALRLVLIAHVALLTLGLLGMAVSWLISIISCLVDLWRKSQSTRNSLSIQRRALFYSTLFYSAGMILGAIWAQATWGRLWSWDPRETFGLFTLAFVVLWIRTIHKPVHSESEYLRFSTMSASISTIAFGAIALMYVLGNRYAAALHSYGLPALILPNLVFGLSTGCLVLIWSSFGLVSRFRRNMTEA